MIRRKQYPALPAWQLILALAMVVSASPALPAQAPPGATESKAGASSSTGPAKPDASHSGEASKASASHADISPAPDASNSADATASAGSSAEYRVGPGDVLSISVWKEPDASGTAAVRPDGKISLPLINEIAVSGLTTAEIQQVVTKGLSPFITDPNVSVSVKEIHSKRVFVIGQVGHTGVYLITEPTTVLQILTAAGGLTPAAKKKAIYVLRMENQKQKMLPFNYNDVVKGKKSEQNIILQPGDTVVVPKGPEHGERLRGRPAVGLGGKSGAAMCVKQGELL